ncbi:MAG: oxidoreductase [Gammaproteobacteria bacterium]|nr:MAG: oxidoreductase [Gammaproteobacteria bacterium]
MTTYKALRVTEQDSQFVMAVEDRDIDQLPEAELLIRVKYSSLNYKDALSAKGIKGVTRQYPHTPGIDAAGVVERSSVNQFQAGDEVIVTGYDLGMNTEGGFAEFISVPASWAIKKPETLSLRDSMILGTAGFTAGMCVDSLLQVGISPSQGDLLVTGACGGVGSVAVALLASLGFDVYAGTGRASERDYLIGLGAKDLLSREELTKGADRPMLKERWAGVVDTVGGEILFNAIKSTQYGGSVACCGMVASAEFQANVFPFILRGVNLLGVDSVELPLEVKAHIWQEFATHWNLECLEAICTEVSLEQLPTMIDAIYLGKQKGRVLVNLG